MSELYDRNFALLKARNFSILKNLETTCGTEINDVEIVKLGGGKMNLVIGGKKAYSERNLDKIVRLRVRKMLEKIESKWHKLMLLAGFGLGYEIEKLLEMLGDVEKMIIVTQPRIFEAAMQLRDLRELLSDKRILEILPNDHLAIRALFEMLYESVISQEVLLVDVGIPGESEEVYRKLYEHYMGMILIKKTAILSKDMAINLSRNIPVFNMCVGVKEYFERFSWPAVVVSGGPSLDSDLENVKKVQNKAIIISISASLKPLLREGIIPDFVLFVDPTDRQYELYMKKVDVPEKTLVVLTPAVNWQFFSDPHYKIVSLYSKQYLRVFELFDPIIMKKGEVFGGGSVAHTALGFALKITSGPVILVGQDLAYPTRGKTHATGSGKEEEVFISEGDPNYIWVKGNYQDLVPTDHLFLEFRNVFSVIANLHKDRILINATSGGAFIEGFELARLDSSRVKELLRERIEKSVVHEIYAYWSRSNADLFSLVNECDKTRSIFDEFIKALEKIEPDVLGFFELMREYKLIFSAVLEIAGMYDKFFEFYGKFRKREMALLEMNDYIRGEFDNVRKSAEELHEMWRSTCNEMRQLYLK